MLNNTNLSVESRITYWKECRGFKGENGPESPDGFAECNTCQLWRLLMSYSIQMSAYIALSLYALCFLHCKQCWKIISSLCVGLFAELNPVFTIMWIHTVVYWVDLNSVFIYCYPLYSLVYQNSRLLQLTYSINLQDTCPCMQLLLK